MSLRATVLPSARAAANVVGTHGRHGCDRPQGGGNWHHSPPLILRLPRPLAASAAPPAALIQSLPQQGCWQLIRALLKPSSKRPRSCISTEAPPKSLRESLVAAGQASRALLASFLLHKSLLAAGGGRGTAPDSPWVAALSRIQSACPDADPVGVGVLR